MNGRGRCVRDCSVLHSTDVPPAPMIGRDSLRHEASPPGTCEQARRELLTRASHIMKQFEHEKQAIKKNLR